MYKYDYYLSLFFYRTNAFLLLSYFHLKAEQDNSKTFSYYPSDLKIVGSKIVLKKEQIRKILPLLEQKGFISIKRESHMKPIIEITLLKEGFLYE
jgi:hypothetical protein